MRARIISTRTTDGGARVTCPTPWVLAQMSCGGWKDMLRGFLETQIERGIAAGRLPDAQRRYVRAMAFGGCSTHEALAIIRDRDCAHVGTGCELWDVDDVPTDRWFRAAWVRSHNGGPINIDMKRARPIQWGHMRKAVALENRRRQEDYYAFGDPVAVDWGALRDRISRADDHAELRRIWVPALLT